MNKQKSRILSYDIIRIIAICAVIMVHSSASILIESSPSSFDYMVGNVFNSLSRLGVPLFIMLSGALILNENKILTKQKLFKNIRQLALLLVIWSLIYAIIFRIHVPLVHHEAVSPRVFWESFFLGHYHLWYLYMMIGLYLVTPILRTFVKQSNRKIILYFIALSILFQFTLPIFNFLGNLITGNSDYWSSLMGQFYMGFVNEYVTYFLLGWYISTIDISKKSRSIIYICGIIGLLIAIFGTSYFSTDTFKAYTVFYQNNSFNILFYSLAVFVFLFYNLKDKHIISKAANTWIVHLSSLSFGVYVIHIVIFEIAYKVLHTHMRFSFLPIWATTLIFSFILTHIISKIPVMQKLVRC